MEVKIGRYRHFKGKEYRVIGVARDSETLKEMVVYQGLYRSEEFGEGAWWVREKENFLAVVERDGKRRPRFEYLGKD